MKTLLLRANPRKCGVTEKLANLFAGGMRSVGADLRDVDLCAAKIEMCRGCFACSATGECPLDDDMRAILAALDGADALVLASPVYFYSMSAQLKVFFDRCFPFVGGYSTNPADGSPSSQMRFKVPRKKLVTIGAASGTSASFEALSSTYRLLARAMGFEYVADICRAESPYFVDSDSRSLRMRSILNAFERAGAEFAQSGKISPATLERAQARLSESDDAFAKRTSIFWRLKKSGCGARSGRDKGVR